VPSSRTDGSVVGHDPVETGPMTVTPTHPRPGLALVRVIGEVDVLTGPRLRDVLGRSLADVADAVFGEDAPSVVCDLEGVTFLGATGLDVLVDTQQRATARGVALVLVAHHRSVLRPFRLTALDSAPCGLTLTDTHPALGRFAADREVGR
jgi:anti-sigma B factor antagonist